MSPSTILRFDTASNASSSVSNTLALPTNFLLCNPASFITAPSGASEPLSTLSVPSCLIGLSRCLITLLSISKLNLTDSKFSFMVLPLTVKTLPFKRFFLSKLLSIIGTPPTLSRSAIIYIPPGLMSAM